MIVKKKISKTLVKTYSDAGKYIIQEETGLKFEEAIDPVSAERVYTESDELIPVPEPEPEDTPEDVPVTDGKEE